MERKNYFIVLIFLVFTISAIGETYKSRIYYAYINSEMGNWKTILDRIQNIENPSNFTRYELLEFQYGYIAWCLGTKKEKEAEGYLEKAWKNLEYLEQKKYKLSSIYGYRSAFYGFEIGLNSVSAPYYGPKSVSYAKKAMKVDESDPMGFIQYANIQYYMPSVFGGSKSEAVEYYYKSISKMESAKNSNQNWIYLSLLATTGQALESLGRKKEAKELYEKALRKEPNFLWIKNELLPNLIKTLQYEK